MSRLRNPFRLRASEKIESDASFLRLFSPIVLDSLIDKAEKNKLWKNVMYIHSSPGAGKSSLLRVFEPTPLNTLLNNKSATDYKSLYTTLKKLDVLTEDKINVLGVILVCTRNYEILEELDISDGLKKRYFFSLLNARIILATLRAAVDLMSPNLNFLEALAGINYAYDNRDNYFSDLDFPCTGIDLYKWASNIERRIYEAIDSFLPITELNQPEGSDELFALSILKPEYLLVNDAPIASNILFMLDDSHKLSNIQRVALKKYVIEKRGDFTIWISERLEALEARDNLRSFEERDYEELNLETFWGERPDKFGKILMNIADKRAGISTDDVNAFKEHLDNDLEEEVHRGEFIKSIKQSQQSILEMAADSTKYDEWLKYGEELDSTPYEKALLYKQIEILVARNIGKPQLALDFPYSKEELQDKLKGDIATAARLFISANTKLPYYYGVNNLIKLSSNNIEQFLAFSANLFEEMLSNKLSRNNINVDTKNQERILRTVTESKWKELSKILPYSGSIIKFLSNLAIACQNDTQKKNAPYAPGVTGFAIKHPRSTINDRKWIEKEVHLPLVNAISTCVAFNLLEVKEVNQGERGQKWDVYYLNRWLCLKFDLPFSYGGWRPKNISELTKWLS